MGCIFLRKWSKMVLASPCFINTKLDIPLCCICQNESKVKNLFILQMSDYMHSEYEIPCVRPTQKHVLLKYLLIWLQNIFIFLIYSTYLPFTSSISQRIIIKGKEITSPIHPVIITL